MTTHSQGGERGAIELSLTPGDQENAPLSDSEEPEMADLSIG